MTQAVEKNVVLSDELVEPQEAARFVDLHCHCLPGLDDGPATIDDATALCRSLADDGIGTVVATAHQLGMYETRVTAKKIRTAVALLQKSLVQNGILLEILAGSDCHVDERIADMLASDDIITLADQNRFLMLELPHNVFIDIEPLIRDLSCRNIGVIISHPERNRSLCRNFDIVKNWLRYHVYLQLTAASLLGDFGHQTYLAAWDLIAKGWASIVATDAHDLLLRPPRLKAAYESISRHCGSSVAGQLCIENPSRMVRSDNPIPVNVPKRTRISEVVS